MRAEFFLYHLTHAGLVALLTQSLNLVWSSNRFSLGHHGYYGLGAYAGVVALRMALPPDRPVTASWGEAVVMYLGCLGAAAIAAGLAGYLTFRAFARLKYDRFAVATLMFAEVVRSIAANWGFVGGGLGYEEPGLAARVWGGGGFGFTAGHAALVVGLNLAVYLAIVRFWQSDVGLGVAAAHDDELAAELAGINVLGLQRFVFTVATALAGLAGGVFLLFTGMVIPGDFAFVAGLPVVLNVVLGGPGPSRCAATAVGLYAAFEVIKLRFFGLFGRGPGQAVADWKEGLIALVLIATIVLPPLARSRRARRTAVGRVEQ